MKFITLGGTYVSNILITYLGDKIDGPVDNTQTEAGFKNVYSLFNDNFKNAMNGETFTAKKEKFFLLLKIAGYLYRPETYSKLTFLLELKNRFKNLEDAVNDESGNTFFVYSTSKLDESCKESDISNFKENLPEKVRDRLIIISTNEDSAFKKYFPTFYLKNQKELDLFENSRPLILSDWEKFVKEWTDKKFFPVEEKKTLSEILN